MLNSRIISHYCKLFCAAANRENTAITGGHVLEHEGKKIYNAGKEEGKKDGKEAERINSIRNLMESLKLTSQQAMDALKIPSEEQPHYFSLL